MKFNATKFLNLFRVWRGKVSDAQEESITFLINAFEKQRVIQSIPQIAYCFATIAHETAWTFRPIKEYRSKIGSAGRANQDRYWNTGYYGRGYVQLTWERNYKILGDRINYDLVSNPDKALDPIYAFMILVHGMNEGLFTGKKLSDFINGNQKDYDNARRIINGKDKAKQISEYALHFEKILKNSAAVSDSKPAPLPVPTLPTSQTPSENAEPTAELVLKEVAKLAAKRGGISAVLTGLGAYASGFDLTASLLIVLAVGLILGFAWYWRKK
jgi:hypothetical protein